MRRYLPLIISFILISAKAHSQSLPSTLWEKPFGGIRNDDIQMAIENMAGGITAVGSTKSKSYRGSDVYLLILDQQGNLLHSDRNYGGKKNDGANAIVQTFDGGYVFVGYTESDWPESIGKRDAWLVKTDEHGIFLWDQILGSIEDDELTDVLQTQDGSLIAVGTRDENAYILKISADGKLEWEHNFKQGKLQVTSCLSLENNEIIITGYEAQKDYSSPFLIKLSSDGNKVIWEKGKSDWEKDLEKRTKLKSIKSFEPYDIILTSQGELAITGTIGIVGKREDMFFLKTDLEGNLLQFDFYGGIREDGSRAIVQTFDGNFVMAGYNSSAAGRGERRSETWANFIQQNGKSIWDDKDGLFGGGQNDEANSITQMSNGSVIIAGYTGQILERDAYFIRLEELAFPKQTSPPVLSAHHIEYHDENANNILDPSERSYLSFVLTNEGEGDAYALTADIDTLSFVDGLAILPDISIGQLPSKASKKITIPIIGSEVIKGGKSTFEVTIKSDEHKETCSFTFQVVSKKEEKPQLEIIGHRFLKEDNDARDAEITIEIELKNTGDAPAKDVYFKFSLPDDVEPLDNRIHDIGDMPPGNLQKIAFRFKANSIYQKDTIRVETRAWEMTRQYGTAVEHEVGIPSFSTILQQKTTTGGKGGGRGPNMNQNLFLDDINIRWSSPNPRFMGKDISIENRAYIDVVFEIESPVSLSNDNFRLLINGEPSSDLVNSVEVIKGYEVTIYGFQATVRLKEEGYDVELEVVDGGKSYRSEKVRLSRKQKKTNLHVYAFGVPYELMYSAKDAQDFSAQFVLQQGDNKIYKNTFIHSYTTSENTTTQAIRDATIDIMNAYDYDETIKKDDTFILFISTHGIISKKNNKFRLIASDFDSRYEDSRSIDFETDMLGFLTDIPVKKLVFLDACHSGSAASNFNESSAASTKSLDSPDTEVLTKAIADLSGTNPGYSILSSCGKGQLSYEDKKWENGAFTRALLEAFKNEEVEGIVGDRIKGDENGDRIIYLDELFYFTKERVPMLLKLKDPKLANAQEPYMPEGQLRQQIPVYVLGN